MQTADIEQIADTVLRRELGKLGLDRVIVQEERDETDERVLSVDAVMKPGTGVLDAAAVSVAHRALSQALQDAGERRFPYFMIRHADDEVPESDIPFEMH